MAKKEKTKGSPPKGEELLASVERESLRKEAFDFSVGDTVAVAVKIEEGGKERIQVFEGVCIGRKGPGTRERFTVRKIIQGEGVERVFPLHSPKVASIKVVRKGKVRRAKLHYLRQRTGKGTRVSERLEKESGQ